MTLPRDFVATSNMAGFGGRERPRTKTKFTIRLWKEADFKRLAAAHLLRFLHEKPPGRLLLLLVDLVSISNKSLSRFAAQTEWLRL